MDKFVYAQLLNQAVNGTAPRKPQFVYPNQQPQMPQPQQMAQNPRFRQPPPAAPASPAAPRYRIERYLDLDDEATKRYKMARENPEALTDDDKKLLSADIRKQLEAMSEVKSPGVDKITEDGIELLKSIGVTEQEIKDHPNPVGLLFEKKPAIYAHWIKKENARRKDEIQKNESDISRNNQAVQDLTKLKWNNVTQNLVSEDERLYNIEGALLSQKSKLEQKLKNLPPDSPEVEEIRQQIAIVDNRLDTLGGYSRGDASAEDVNRVMAGYNEGIDREIAQSQKTLKELEELEKNTPDEKEKEQIRVAIQHMKDALSIANKQRWVVGVEGGETENITNAIKALNSQKEALEQKLKNLPPDSQEAEEIRQQIASIEFRRNTIEEYSRGDASAEDVNLAMEGHNDDIDRKIANYNADSGVKREDIAATKDLIADPSSDISFYDRYKYLTDYYKNTGEIDTYGKEMASINDALKKGDYKGALKYLPEEFQEKLQRYRTRKVPVAPDGGASASPGGSAPGGRGKPQGRFNIAPHGTENREANKQQTAYNRLSTAQQAMVMLGRGQMGLDDLSEVHRNALYEARPDLKGKSGDEIAADFKNFASRFKTLDPYFYEYKKKQSADRQQQRTNELNLFKLSQEEKKKALIESINSLKDENTTSKEELAALLVANGYSYRSLPRDYQDALRNSKYLQGVDLHQLGENEDPDSKVKSLVLGKISPDDVKKKSQALSKIGDELHNRNVKETKDEIFRQQKEFADFDDKNKAMVRVSLGTTPYSQLSASEKRALDDEIFGKTHKVKSTKEVAEKLKSLGVTVEGNETDGFTFTLPAKPKDDETASAIINALNPSFKKRFNYIKDGFQKENKSRFGAQQRAIEAEKKNLKGKAKDIFKGDSFKDYRIKASDDDYEKFAIWYKNLESQGKKPSQSDMENYAKMVMAEKNKIYQYGDAPEGVSPDAHYQLSESLGSKYIDASDDDKATYGKTFQKMIEGAYKELKNISPRDAAKLPQEELMPYLEKLRKFDEEWRMSFKDSDRYSVSPFREDIYLLEADLLRKKLKEMDKINESYIGTAWTDWKANGESLEKFAKRFGVDEFYWPNKNRSKFTELGKYVMIARNAKYGNVRTFEDLANDMKGIPDPKFDNQRDQEAFNFAKYILPQILEHQKLNRHLKNREKWITQIRNDQGKNSR